MKRIQTEALLKDLTKKMVFLVGPRQAGKTWIAKEIAKNFAYSVYLNYDSVSDRQIIHSQAWLPSTELLILDELHKMPDWKNFLKGVYDTKEPALQILVTGSARLDIYDQLGDSLAGRYFRHRLLPLSLAELFQAHENVAIEQLIERGGFPEPYFAENAIEAQRWRIQYVTSILGTDVFEVDRIQNVKAMQLLFNLLRHRVGSPISFESLVEDIQISANTIKRYIEILEALYVIFRITPYSNNIARSLLKEPKIYFFDTGLVEGDEGAKFENLVAVSLLKETYARVDYLAEERALHYIKTKDKQEIDFALVQKSKVDKIIEVKLSNSTISRPLLYFHEKYGYPAVQLVRYLRNEFVTQTGIQVRNAENFLENLFL